MAVRCRITLDSVVGWQSSPHTRLAILAVAMPPYNRFYQTKREQILDLAVEGWLKYMVETVLPTENDPFN